MPATTGASSGWARATKALAPASSLTVKVRVAVVSLPYRSFTFTVRVWEPLTSPLAAKVRDFSPTVAVPV